MSVTAIFADIVSSSVWNEDDETRIVWVTLLSLKNTNHIVPLSLTELSFLARVSLEDCQRAVNKLSSPDPGSRSSAYEGRRLEKVEGGFLILNGSAYRKKRDKDRERQYRAEYMRMYRRKQKKSS